MNSKLLTLLALIGGVLIMPTSFILAQSLKYEPLIGIPGLGNGELDFGKYINALYALSISVAALMAVIKIIIAGVKYMLTDIVTSKSDAINDIRSSILGLIVVISAVLILTVINPQLAKTEIFLDPVTTTPNSAGGSGTATVTTGNGYTSVPLGKAPEFKANCERDGGLYVVAVVGGATEVCYAPLSQEFKDGLATLYSGGTDMEVIEQRYQRAHLPALITDKGKMTAIGTEHKGATLLALTYTAPYDWIDKENRNTIGYTCRALQIASNTPVVTIVNTAGGYLACVKK